MTYKIYTLGCKVNEYESEVMGNLFEGNGYSLSDNPDVCVVNTCTVTNTADSKSRKLIRSVRRNNPSAILVVVGCLIQNNGGLASDLGADIVLGNKDKSKIISLINEFKGKRIEKLYDINDMDFEDMTLEKSDLTRAYIKIQDGCDNYCTYCIIPYVRGHVRCKDNAKILSEALALVKAGHKEIVLTGIHTGNYHFGDYDFADLLSDLVKVDGLERLRISSVEITELNDKFLDVLKNSDKLTNHMHIPLQSGCDSVLKKMNRKYDVDYFVKRINKIREIRPNINITTDVIVGFPGESNLDFEETIATIKNVNFTKLHVFPYSKREGTMAAGMTGQVDGRVKKERVKRLLELSKELELNYMNNFLNTKVTFIPEVYKDGYLIGHSDNFLLIKAKGEEADLKKDVVVNIKKIDYPYVLGVNECTDNIDMNSYKC